MPQKTEKLDKELIDRLSFLRDETNKIVIVLGQVSIRKNELEVELETLEKEQSKYIGMNKKYTQEINEKLTELDKTYKNGQVDLDNGVIIYEE